MYGITEYYQEDPLMDYQTDLKYNLKSRVWMGRLVKDNLTDITFITLGDIIM
jgi:hypothetical protein